MSRNYIRLILSAVVVVLSTSGLQASLKDEGFIKGSIGKNIRGHYALPKYEELTTLKCTHNGKVSQMTQICFDVHSGSGKIGEILLQYYPFAKCQYYGEDTSPAHTVRLRHIEIDSGERRKGHAGRALETLFTVLRRNGLPSTAEVWLECNVNPSYLIPFYEKFGFQNAGKSSFGDVIFDENSS